MDPTALNINQVQRVVPRLPNLQTVTLYDEPLVARHLHKPSDSACTLYSHSRFAAEILISELNNNHPRLTSLSLPDNWSLEKGSPSFRIMPTFQHLEHVSAPSYIIQAWALHLLLGGRTKTLRTTGPSVAEVDVKKSVKVQKVAEICAVAWNTMTASEWEEMMRLTMQGHCRFVLGNISQSDILLTSRLGQGLVGKPRLPHINDAELSFPLSSPPTLR